LEGNKGHRRRKTLIRKSMDFNLRITVLRVLMRDLLRVIQKAVTYRAESQK
jgi:hypothetical protein